MNSTNSALARLRETSRIDYFAALLHGHAPTIALRAFHAEVCAIPFRVTDPMAGEVRLQWWRDVVTGERAEEASADPVGLALVETLSTRDAWREALLAKLDAHTTDLYADPFPDWNSFHGYAGETRSVLYELAARDLDKDERYAEASGHAGVTEALAERLSSWPISADRTMPALPGDFMDAVGQALSSAQNVQEALAGKPRPVRKVFARSAVDRARCIAAQRDPLRVKENGLVLSQASLQWRLWRGV